MAQNKKRIKNIAKIISNDKLQINLINITKINGICENKYDFYWDERNVSFCNRCKMMICDRCTNNRKDKCVLCELNSYKNMPSRCGLCGKCIIYCMCNMCGKTIRSCETECYLSCVMWFTIFPDDNEIVKCAKCQ